MKVVDNVSECDKTSDNQLQNDIEHLTDWLKKQQHLPDEMDKIRITWMYKVSDGNLQKTKQLIDEYITNMAQFFEIYSHWDDLEERLNKYFDMCVMAFLPGRFPSTENVLVYSILDADPMKYSYEDFCMVMTILIELEVLRHDEGRKMSCVLDMSGFSAKHITRTGFNKFKQITMIGKAMAKNTSRDFHYINFPIQNAAVIGLLQTVPNKSSNRTYFHPKVECLKEYYPIDLLPKEFGGNGPTLRDLNEKARKDVLSMVDFMRQQRKWMKVNESKRIVENINNRLFGAEGSFKQLQID